MKIKAFIILSVALFLANSGCLKKRAEPYASVIFLMGDVKRNGSAVLIGDAIKSNDSFSTGSLSFCDIRIGGSYLRIKEKSNTAMTEIKNSKSGKNVMSLGIGKLLCKTKIDGSDVFLIKTPTAVAAAKEAQFIIEADSLKSVRLKVFSGKVRIARRLKQFEGNIEKILDLSPLIEKDQKTIITLEDINAVEKKLDSVQKGISSKGGGAGLDDVLAKANDIILISSKDIVRFSAEDIQRDNSEIIDIEKRKPEIVDRLSEMIKLDKKAPKPLGRLLIKRLDIYYIKNGKVEWEGKITEPPFITEGRVYVATGEYVMCASEKGPVYWRRQFDNDGKLVMREGRLFVLAGGGEFELNPLTGDSN